MSEFQILDIIPKKFIDRFTDFPKFKWSYRIIKNKETIFCEECNRYLKPERINWHNYDYHYKGNVDYPCMICHKPSKIVIFDSAVKEKIYACNQDHLIEIKTNLTSKINLET